VMLSSASRELADLTVVILSHNRQNCLFPALKYWENLGIHTLVLDESPIPLKGFEDFSFSTYLNIDRPFTERCRIASTLLDSKYSIVVSDDELYTPSGLIEMKKALDTSQELISVGGVAMAVWKYGNQISGSWPYKGTFRYENLESNPLNRIKKHTGVGKHPLSAFFTSNMNRTKFLVDCLNLYAKSPVIATEAISILTICAAGKSKYIDSLFWVRNWNEFPKSHANWDRSVYLHNWWRDQKGTSQWMQFYEDLRNAYEQISSDDKFESIWELILEANEVSQPNIPPKKYIKRKNFTDSNPARYFKYFIKKATRSSNVPKDYEEVLLEMQSKGVSFNFDEVEIAVKAASAMRPYKNWK
jgi:hypothetical protein